MSTFERLEILVEEPSMEVFLEGLLPRILGSEVEFAVHGFNGKKNLLKKLPKRLKGYSNWLPPIWGLMILVDQDFDDCRELKQKLEKMAGDAGFLTRSAAGKRPYRVANRIVVQELEACYFGDWTAVQEAFPRVSLNTTKKARYREPDGIQNTWEAFERILQAKGYFVGGLQKKAAAREISKFMVPERNCSRSFQVFYETLLELKGDHG